MRASCFVVLLAGCSHGTSREPVSAAVDPPVISETPPVEHVSDDSCEHYLRHADEISHLTHTEPYSDAELASCHQHTDEQLGCAIAATTEAELVLCENFTDPIRRDLGRKLTRSIERDWPGSAPLRSVLTDTNGCAVFGVMGRQGFELTETNAVVAFAIRASTKGGATSILATLVRANDGDWRCVSSDPPSMCRSLSASCKRGP